MTVPVPASIPAVIPGDGVDVIGDIHGHIDPLVRLLRELGYEPVDGVWRHPSRTAAFIGDLVDRGPGQIEVLELVRAMVEAGSARIVLGNHEFNAVAFATEWPDRPGEFARRRDHSNRRQHAVFLEAVGVDSPVHDHWIEWFHTIPMWDEVHLGEATLRLIHACWSERDLDVVRPLLGPERTLTTEFVLEASRRGSPVYESLEVLIKGPEAHMGGATYRDKEGHVRDKARLQWWLADARTLREAVLIPGNATGMTGEVPDIPIDNEHLYTSDIPVIVGHYWAEPGTVPWSDKVACVDHSIAKGGHLAAYRWSGEPSLVASNIVSVPAHP